MNTDNLYDEPLALPVKYKYPTRFFDERRKRGVNKNIMRWVNTDYIQTIQPFMQLLFVTISTCFFFGERQFLRRTTIPDGYAVRRRYSLVIVMRPWGQLYRCSFEFFLCSSCNKSQISNEKDRAILLRSSGGNFLSIFFFYIIQIICFFAHFDPQSEVSVQMFMFSNSVQLYFSLLRNTNLRTYNFDVDYFAIARFHTTFHFIQFVASFSST